MALSVPGKKIGLLGGSFNPAHDGHVYISKQALDILGLDEVWWLVSPQNPLKSTREMSEFSERIDQAAKIASSCQEIIVSDFEKMSGTRYTFDTLVALKNQYHQHNFVWLMGADNLLQFPKWHKWQEIMQIVPIAIFNRGDLKAQAINGLVAREFASSQCFDSKTLSITAPPAWMFLDIKTHPGSATKIRQGK